MTNDHTAELQAVAKLCPKPPQWSQYLTAPVPKMGRPFRVGFPCAGLDTGEDLDAMGLHGSWEAHCVYDLEEGCRTALECLYKRHGAITADVHLGRRNGDLTRVAPESLDEIHLLRGGPPCPPWSAQGGRDAQQDTRARVFEHVVRWLIFLAYEKGLLAVCLENVKGVLREWKGQVAFYIKLAAVLRKYVPFWNWRIDSLNARDYKVPHHRPRVFLRGLHKKCAPVEVPPCLPPFGRATLKYFLSPDLPHFPMAELTHQQQLNHASYLSLLWATVAREDLQPNDTVVVALDRAANRTFQQEWWREATPTLTTSRGGGMLWTVYFLMWRLAPREREREGEREGEPRVDTLKSSSLFALSWPMVTFTFGS